MTTEASIISDSYALNGARITTWRLRYPRFIHAEVMTHRVISRNASSSRAIPVDRMLAMIESDPAKPVSWGKNKAGMQASELVDDADALVAETIWLEAMADAIKHTKRIQEKKVHKQIANRLAEPFAHITVVATGTQWTNFFTLRKHPDAQPEFQELAEKMALAYQQSTPRKLLFRDWHLPYVTDEERARTDLEIDPIDGIPLTLCRWSVARCARVSYLKFDGTNPDPKSDEELYARLVLANPKHMSPTEHQGTPFPVDPIDPVMSSCGSRWMYPFDLHWNDKQKCLEEFPWSGNLRGFFQYRKTIMNESADTMPWEMAS